MNINNYMSNISKLHSHSESLKKYNLARSFDNRINNLSLEWIPFEDLLVTQNQLDTFDPNHVADICKEYHPAIVRASSVAHIGDKYILWEGQHSATVNWLAGLNNIPCIVYKCDNLDFKQVPSIEKFDSGQMADLITMFVEDSGAKTLDDVLHLIKQYDNFV